MEELVRSKRYYGIDLVKILSMFLVVCGHILMQGGVYPAEQYGTVGYYLTTYFYTIAICAVDCFVIVNGYVSCRLKFKLSRIIELWTIVVFWSVVVSCFVMIIQPEKRSFDEAVSMFFPILRGRYWFFNAYFVLFMFQPILNHLIETLSEAKYKAMLFAIVCIFGFIPVASLGNDVLKFSDGSEFCWFFMLYLVGGYLRKYGEKIKYNNKWNLVIFFSLAFLNIIYKFIIEHVSTIAFGKPNWGDLLMINSSPIILGEAVTLILFFIRIPIKENSVGVKLIKYVSPLVFSVYIIHVHPFVFWNPVVVDRFTLLADLNPILTIMSVFCVAFVVYFVCLLQDLIRQKIFEVIRIRDKCQVIGERVLKKVCLLLRIERFS